MKKQPSRLSIRHHLTPPIPGSIAARQETQLGGRKHRPKWPSFTCAIHCSVLVPAVLANTSATTEFGRAQPYPHPLPPSPNASATIHNSPNLRIQTRTTTPLPSLPFPVQRQGLTFVATVSASHTCTRSRAAHPSGSSLLQLKYVTSIQYCNIHISSSVFYYPFPHIQYYKACNFISEFSGSSIILFNSFGTFHIFSMLDTKLTFKNKIKDFKLIYSNLDIVLNEGAKEETKIQGFQAGSFIGIPNWKVM